MDFATAFGGESLADGAWEFDLPERFNGAFGGTNGGVLSALSVFAARRATGRRPAGIDSRYLRGFRPGAARVVPKILNEGRTLAVVSVAIVDRDDRVCTQSTVTLVAPERLAVEIEASGNLAPPQVSKFEDGRPWPTSPDRPIPMIETFRPTHLGSSGQEVCTGVAVIWDEPDTSAEAACIAADVSVGPPVMRAVRGAASIPNPDLSLRFVHQGPPARRLVGACALAGIEAGLASTRIAVWQDDLLLAIGVSTTTCLPLG